MTADAQGNDLSAVGIPTGGRIAFAEPIAANVVAKEDMGVWPLELPSAAKVAGLIKVDGGPTEARESEDPIEFFQEGYTLAGSATRTTQATFAELNDAVLQLTEGKEPDANGVIEVDSSLPDNRYIVYEVVVYRSGRRRFRQGVASVTAVEPDQPERGSVHGTAVTFTWQPDPLFNGAPFWQYLSPVPSAGGTGGGTGGDNE